MTLTVTRVNWFDPRAVALREAMNEETGKVYDDVLATMSRDQLDAIDAALGVDPTEIAATILVLDGDEPVGHAALRPFERMLEVKKVFVPKQHRGRGISKTLMLALEDIARERGVEALILQTGDLQLVAISLYERLGYEQVPAFGRYVGMPFAVCFRKSL